MQKNVIEMSDWKNIKMGALMVKTNEPKTKRQPTSKILRKYGKRAY